MANVELDLVVETSGNVVTWLYLDDEIVPLTNGKGSTDVSSPGDHRLSWEIMGTPGDTIKVSGTVDDDEVVGGGPYKVMSATRPSFGVLSFKLPKAQ